MVCERAAKKAEQWVLYSADQWGDLRAAPTAAWTGHDSVERWAHPQAGLKAALRVWRRAGPRVETWAALSAFWMAAQWADN